MTLRKTIEGGWYKEMVTTCCIFMMRLALITIVLFGICADSYSQLRLNHIQVIGSHNSYKEAIEPSLFRALTEQDSSRFMGLEYEHVSLTEQVQLGLRKLELDIFYDPDGGLLAHPQGLELVKQRGDEPLPYDEDSEMLSSGFKVLHIQDIDYRSNCLTLESCLNELKSWSEENPLHLPIFISFNAKDQVIPLPGSAKPLGFNSTAFNELDQELIRVLGRDKIVMPDDVRGSFKTLHQAISKNGWPLLEEVRGKFIFILDEGGEKLETYIAGHPALTNRVLFVNAVEGTPEAAIRIVNDPIKDRDYIQNLVKAGYIVRTRADANTMEARTGETKRRDVAFESGAHLISTDYYQLPNLFGTDYVVQLPGVQEAICNPILSSDAACQNKDLRK